MNGIVSYLDFDSLLERLAALLLALILHDLVQAWAARLMGNRTPQQAGRLTLNPIPFLDPVGLVVVLFGPFGWSREVPMGDTGGRRGRWTAALAYLAGPVYYGLAALLCWWLSFELPALQGDVGGGLLLLQTFLYQCYIVHALLLLLNLLIPFYPTDLWKIIRTLVAPRLPAVARFEKLGLVVIIPLLVLPGGGAWLQYLLDSFTAMIMHLFR